MLSKKEINSIKKCAIKYNVSSVVLFGSSLEKKVYRDIDLAVKGISPESFFGFYADLFKHLSRDIDLIDLDEVDSYLSKRILTGGKLIYEAQ